MPVTVGGAPLCPRCQMRVYFNEEKWYMGRSWHKKCFTCAERQCRKALESGLANLENNEVYCNNCHRHLFPDPSVAPAQRRPLYVNKDDPECCPRCGKRVYFAEQQLNLGRKWHKSCFCCAACNKKVDSTSCADHDGELYCKSCHGKNFGPKGYGFAGGAGTMLSMDTGKPHEVTRQNVPHTMKAYVAPLARQNGANGINSETAALRPRWGGAGGEVCARCAKQVYMAERKQAAGNVYHMTCFTCASCKNKLDSTKLTEKNTEIYCKACYGKNFAPKGYGYGGGAGALQMS